MIDQALLDEVTISIPHKLRILIVDDNQINLAVLSTLLKRRFGALIEGVPVAVDSGLKAIQLMRTNVFDLVLMDIQMPFLSGLDATRRIRNVEDDVLEANANAHIVAVTTAVGDEPEAAYRRAGMDGMIGKPVRFQDLHHYLTPLAREAQHAASSMSKISINGQSIMPPLPPVVSRYERLFYLPANATIRSPCPDICQGADFEKMLKAQTRASLRRSGALAIGRGFTVGGRSPSRRPAIVDNKAHKTATTSINEENLCTEGTVSTDVSSGKETTQEPLSPLTIRRHVRHSTLTINKSTLSQQIQREMENLEGHDSDASEATVTQSSALKRPAAINRVSSPAWMMSLKDRSDFDEELHSPAIEDLSLASTSSTLLTRPKWLIALKTRGGGSRGQEDVGGSQSSTSSQCSEGSFMVSEERRDSQQSCGSDMSDLSTDSLRTPSSEAPPCVDVLQAFLPRQRAESGSSCDTLGASATEKIHLSMTRMIDDSDDLVHSPTEILGRRSFNAEEISTLSHGLRQFGLEP